MAEYTVLSWQNENSLASYPLVYPLDYEGFIVDASFIQFDYFVPILKSIFISPGEIAVTVLFDRGEVTEIYSTSKYNLGVRELRFFENNERYLGCLTLGERTDYMWENFSGQNLVKNIPFMPSVVRSIPSKDAVYALDNAYGDIFFDVELNEVIGFTTPGSFNFQNSFIPGLSFQSTGGGESIFYNFRTDRNALVFNAVANHKLPEDDFSPWALKRVNLVAPVDNNLYLTSNELIKFSSINNQKIVVSLAGESASGASIVPTLAS